MGFKIVERILKMVMGVLIIWAAYLGYEIYELQQQINELNKTECNIK